MIRIGTVNIDTSHAPSFAEILLKGEDARYTAIYNDGFRTDAEVEHFIEKYGLEKRYYDLSEMAKNIDVAFIQSCNWDRHIELSKPFIDAGVPVFIDKPIAGNLKDLKEIERLAANGAVIIGTSAMRYTYEHDSFFAVPEENRGNVLHVTAMVGVDEFNYAIHAVESIMGFLPGIKPVSTRYLGTGNVNGAETDSYFVRFDNGAAADYHICKKCWQPSTALVLTDKTGFAYKIDSNKVYEAMLKRFVRYMNGEKEALASVESMTDSVKIMLAGIKSRANGGSEEFILNLSENDPSFDGYAFEEFYAAQQRK
ncbi:MAG: Gfo/Idh/MocA family oxidoreductase [Clostridia bacterium]|nr:Gfo/Idh/MocA family oxidoreductase [Clostridia bacterium]